MTASSEPAPAAPAVATTAPAPAPAGSRRLRSARGKQYEYDPSTGAAAVVEPDGWRAVVPAGSSTGVTAWLLHSTAEITDGRGSNVTEQDARARLDRLTAAELRELADETGTSIKGARTKSQMIDTLVTSMISVPRERPVRPAAVAGPGPGHPAGTPLRQVAAVPVPSRSPEEIRPPNGAWGVDQGLMHFDGALGRLWNSLGDDQHLQVDGRALGNVVTELGEGITLRHHDTNHAVRELRRIRTQVPDGSSAARSIDVALGRLAAPDRPVPALPANAPHQVKDLMAELNAIPLVRRGYDVGSGAPFHETDRLAEATNRWMNGEINRSQYQRQLEDLLRGRHESSEGWTEIKVAVGRALDGFRQWARRPD